jgi:ubiquinone/menaquinone biosynthesis C-methylase UbiE
VDQHRTDPWSRVARWYDWQLPLERPALRALVGMVAISGGDTLLDVGTGTGGVLREMERRGVSPARTIGADASEPMLARARAAVSPKTELIRADARALPMADATVDVVTCSYLLHLLAPETRGDVLAEIRRVLRPGGRLGIVTVAPPRSALTGLITAPVRAAAERSSGALAGLRSLDPSTELERAGFTVEVTRRVRAAPPSLCVRAKRP